MGAVKVTLSVLRTTAERQQELAGEFDKYLNEISTVRSYFSSLGSSSWSGIPDTCSKVSDKLLNCQNGMKNASGKLQEMIAQYEKSENTVLGISPVIVRTDAAGTASGMSQSDRFIADLKRQGYDVSGISNMDVTTYQYIMRTGQLPKNYSSGIKGLSQSEGYIEDLRRQGYDVSGITSMDATTYQNIKKNGKNSVVEKKKQENDADTWIEDNSYVKSEMGTGRVYADEKKTKRFCSDEVKDDDGLGMDSVLQFAEVGSEKPIFGEHSKSVGKYTVSESWYNYCAEIRRANAGVFTDAEGNLGWGVEAMLGIEYALAKGKYDFMLGDSFSRLGLGFDYELGSAEAKVGGQLGVIDNKLNAYLEFGAKASAVEVTPRFNQTLCGIKVETALSVGYGADLHLAGGLKENKAVFDIGYGTGVYADLNISIDPSELLSAVGTAAKDVLDYGKECVTAIKWIGNELFN